VPRQITFDSTYDLAQSNYDFYHRNAKDEMYVNFYATPFYQQSTRAAQLAPYFLPYNKCAISLREDGLGDVDPLWLNLISPTGSSYNSILTLRPERQVFGSVLQFYLNLPFCEHQFWMSVTSAALCAQHAIRVRESAQFVSQIATQGIIANFANACQALNSPCWCAGKFGPCKLRRAGLDDIQIKLGYDYFFCDQYHVGVYLVGGIPTGYRQTSVNIFEPIVGSKNGSIGAGVNSDYTFLSCDDHCVSWMFDLKYQYVFRANERRSFDLLRNGDWSRYLQVVSAASPAFPLPAINLLTTDVFVTPGSTINFWTALNYNYCSCNVEIGYNLWWRQQEKICLHCPFPNTFAIYDLVGGCHGIPISASTANISESIVGPNIVPSDTIFTPVTAQNINVDSAAAPAALSNKIYLALARDIEIQSIITFVGIGASYEIGNSYTALSNWALWGKIGFSY